MNTKSKSVSFVQETDSGIKLFFFQERIEPEQVIINTGVKRCSLENFNLVKIIYSDLKCLYPLGIIGQACASCEFKPGNKEGGCRAYYK